MATSAATAALPVANAWLLVLGFPQQLQQLNAYAVQELADAAPAVHFSELAVAATLSSAVEERVQALANTIGALMKRLGHWATAAHAHQHTSHDDRNMLALPPTTDEHVDEWVRCCTFCAQLILIFLAQLPLRQTGGSIFLRKEEKKRKKNLKKKKKIKIKKKIKRK